MAMSTGKVVALIQAMGGADPAVIEAKVQDWLDAHPEATTTVQDGSITEQKLATSIAQKLGLISSLSDEIDGIEDKFTYANGKNLLDVSACVPGYLNSNGTIHENPSGGDWVTTDFIPVIPGESIIASYTDSNSARAPLGMYFFLNYNTSKTIVGSQISSAPRPYTIPENVQYIRFSWHSNMAEPMVEKGTEQTAYVPYAMYTLLKSTDYARKSESLPNKMDGLKWCVVGDSLTEKNIRAQKAYYDYIAEDLGLTIYNLGASGTGYARTKNTFAVRTLHAGDFDFMTIFGSFNDAGSGLPIGTPTDTGNSTICACINAAIDNFYTNTPYKPLGLITPCPWATVTPDSEWGNAYCDAIIAIGKRRGIPVLDLFRCSGIRPWAGEAYLAEYYNENGEQDNGTHPNSKGHKMFLYPHIKQFVQSLIQGLPNN